MSRTRQRAWSAASLLAGWVGSLLAGAGAQAATTTEPTAGRDYYSLQLASGDARALSAQFRNYAQLPYLRIERRGKLHVLRAGFWPTKDEARPFLASATAAASSTPLLRTATYRPDDIVRSNFYGREASTATALTPLAATIATPSTATQARREAAVPHAGHFISPAPMSGGNPSVTPAAPPAPPVVTPAPAASATSPSSDGSPIAFNNEDYELAYSAFLAARDLPRGFALASRAVASQPDDALWRRRLAQLAEWTQRPLIAWDNWYWLQTHGQTDAEVLSAIIRLAPVMGEPDAAIAALAVLARRQGLTPAQWQDIRKLYEEAGRQRDGSAYFEQQARLMPADAAQFIEWAAQLAQQAGDDERALQLYRQRLGLAPFALPPAVSAVTLLVLRDRLREAYQLMQELKPQVPAEAHEFWRLLARVAFELAETETAREAYARSVRAPDAQMGDWSRLIQLTQEHAPREAAQLALEAWRRFDNLDYLIDALSLYTDQRDRRALGRVFADLSAKERTQAEQSSRFLALRAQWHREEGRPGAAWLDIQRALALAPNDTDVQLAALWLLIDSDKSAELAALLARVSAQSGTGERGDIALALAAGYQHLGQAREAVHWYRQALRGAPDDPLLLISYADALEQFHQPGMAERIRRHAFLRLRSQLRSAGVPQPGDEAADTALQALARLQLRNAPGDPALDQVRVVAARLRAATPPIPAGDGRAAAPLTPAATAADDLILAWALSTGQTDSARAWMWLRQARRAGTSPAWAQAAVTLQSQDLDAIRRLLDAEGKGLAAGDRHDALQALGDWPQAEATAFEALTADDADDTMHERLRLDMPGHRHWLQVGHSDQSYGTLDIQQTDVDGRWQAQRNLALTFGWSTLDQTLDDVTGPWLPNRERTARLGAQWQDARGELDASLWRRDEFATNTGARLRYEFRADRRLSLTADMAVNADSDLSTAMRLAGQADDLQLAANWQLGKRESVRLAPRWQRFYTQTGDYLGHGFTLDAEAGYQFNIDYPDTRLRAFVTDQHITADGAVGSSTLAGLPADVQATIDDGSLDPLALFLPESNRTTGLCLSMGENIGGQNLRETYSHAWRGFYDLCRTSNDINGSGHSVSVGVAGAVAGNDHLLFSYDDSVGGSGSGAKNRVVRLRYRHYF